MRRNKPGNEKAANKQAAGGPPPWSVPVALDEIPETGRHVELSPDATMRDAVARTAGVVSLPRLEATFDLARHGRDGLRVAGRVSATVEQNCVVTLERMQSEVDEAVDLVFVPPRTPVGDGEDDAGRAGVEADAPETLRDGVVNLGALTIEFLILGIDPYPRKPDAVFDAPPAGDP